MGRELTLSPCEVCAGGCPKVHVLRAIPDTDMQAVGGLETYRRFARVPRLDVTSGRLEKHAFAILGSCQLEV